MRAFAIIDKRNNVKKFGFMNEKNDIIIKPKYEEAKSFSEGLACICINGKWGFIDENENLSIECKYDEAESFFDGYANVAISKSAFYDKGFSYQRSASVLYWGIINKKGELIIPTEYIKLKKFWNGFAIGERNIISDYANSNRLKCVIDNLGNELPLDLFDIKYKSDFGDIAVKKINTENKDCIESTYADANEKTVEKTVGRYFFSEKNNKWGIVDKNDMIICQYIFDKIEQVNDALIFVIQDGKLGAINNKGKIVIPINCNRIIIPVIDKIKIIDEKYIYRYDNRCYYFLGFHYCYNILQPFKKENINDCVCYVSMGHKGMFYVPNEAPEIILHMSNCIKDCDLLILEMAKGVDLYSLSNGFITNSNYQSIAIICKGYFVVLKDGKFGLIDSQGEEILLVKYDELIYYGGSLVICKINNLCKVFNIDTKKFELEAVCNDLVLLYYNETIDSDLGHLFVKIETDEYAEIPVLIETMTVENFKRKIGVEKLCLKRNKIARENGYVTNEKDEIVAQLSCNIIKKEDVKNPMIGISEDGIAYLYNEVKSFEIIDSKGKNIFSSWSFYEELSRNPDSSDEFENRIESHYYSLKYLPVSFSEDRILCGNKEDKFGFYDAKNSFMIIPFRYSQIIYRDDDIFDICKNGKWGVLDIKNCKEILPCKYDNKIPHFFDTSEYQISGNKGRLVDLIAGKRLCIVKEDGHYGCIDDSYKEIIPTIYHHIMFEKGNRFVFCGYGGSIETDYIEERPFCGYVKDAQWGCFDNTGNCIIPVAYNNIEIIEDYIVAGKGSWLFQGQYDCNNGSYSFFEGKFTLFTSKGEKILDNFNEIQIDDNTIKVRRDAKYKTIHEEYGMESHYVVDGYDSVYDKEGNLLNDRVEIEKEYIPNWDNCSDDDDNYEDYYDGFSRDEVESGLADAFEDYDAYQTWRND